MSTVKRCHCGAPVRGTDDVCEQWPLCERVTSTPKVGDTVRWTYTVTRRGKAVEAVVEGRVISLDGPSGRLVVDVNGETNHVQPSFVEVVR